MRQRLLMSVIYCLKGLKKSVINMAFRRREGFLMQRT